jgi:hypothetical protein
MTDAEIAKAAVFTQDEIDFINAQALKAFSREDRPYVLIGICGAIVGNLVSQSGGKLTLDEVLKWVGMATELE